jgi:hypothetical protein
MKLFNSSETHEVSVLLGKTDFPIILWEPSSVEEWKQLRIQDYVNVWILDELWIIEFYIMLFRDITTVHI